LVQTEIDDSPIHTIDSNQSSDINQFVKTVGINSVLNKNLDYLETKEEIDKITKEDQQILDYIQTNYIQDDNWDKFQLLLLGEPGSGKTFQVYKIMDLILNHTKNNKTNLIPWRITVSSWQDEKFTSDVDKFKKFIAEQISENAGVGFNYALEYLFSKNSAYKFILFLDAFDEIKSGKQKASFANCLGTRRLNFH